LSVSQRILQKNAENVIFSAFFRDVANGKRTDKKEKRKSPLNGIHTKKGGIITRLSRYHSDTTSRR